MKTRDCCAREYGVQPWGQGYLIPTRQESIAADGLDHKDVPDALVMAEHQSDAMRKVQPSLWRDQIVDHQMQGKSAGPLMLLLVQIGSLINPMLSNEGQVLAGILAILH